MSGDFDLAAFEASLEETLRQSRIAFKGKYKNELNDLAGLSREEIDAITPGITDLEAYDQLVTVVKEASRANLDQAELKKRIEKLGDLAVRIAKKVPSIARILVV